MSSKLSEVRRKKAQPRINASLKNGPADDVTAESIKFFEDELLQPKNMVEG